MRRRVPPRKPPQKRLDPVEEAAAKLQPAVNRALLRVGSDVARVAAAADLGGTRRDVAMILDAPEAYIRRLEQYLDLELSP